MNGPNKLPRWCGSFTITSVIGCLLVVASIFLQWSHLFVPGWQIGHSDGMYGYPKMAGQAFALLALVLVLTHTEKPVRLWKPLLLGLASATTLTGLGVWRFNLRDSPIRLNVNGVAQTLPTTVSAAQGFYLAFGASMALLLFSLWQIRLSFRTRPGPPDPTRLVILLQADVVIKRLRWVMLGVMIFDLGVTLYGQPPTFWKNPATARESNRLVYEVMQLGLSGFLIVSVAYGLGSVVLVSVLPQRLGGMLWLLLTLGHWFGGSSWLYFPFGMAYGPAWYAATLAVLVVRLATGIVVCDGPHDGKESG